MRIRITITNVDENGVGALKSLLKSWKRIESKLGVFPVVTFEEE